MATASLKGEGLKIKVSDPKSFSGARSSNDLVNLLWDIQQYFHAARIPDTKNVTYTNMYLTGDAKLWWQVCVEGKHARKSSRRTTWRQSWFGDFLLCIRLILQEGPKTKAKNVKKALLFDVRLKNMFEEDKHFNFLDGLDNWPPTELQKAKPKNLASGISIVDSLVDFRPDRAPANSGKEKGKARTSLFQKKSNRDPPKKKYAGGDSGKQKKIVFF